MDIRKVKKLIELLDESGIAEIEITEGDIFSRQRVTATQEALANRLGQDGYAFANINAVPEGASFFHWWWMSSTITGQSNSWSSTR